MFSNPNTALNGASDRDSDPMANFGFVSISAPMFRSVMFPGITCRFVSAASDSYPPMSQIEV